MRVEGARRDVMIEWFDNVNPTTMSKPSLSPNTRTLLAAFGKFVNALTRLQCLRPNYRFNFPSTSPTHKRPFSQS